VLPMCDEPVRTHVRTDAGWRDFQQFMIRDQAKGPVHEVAFTAPARASRTSEAREGASASPMSTMLAPLTPTDAEGVPPAMGPAPRPTPEVLTALSEARAVIVGPSNPVISIWPILHVLGEALAEIAAPVVCVSPIVGGEVVKGPTAAFLAAYDQPVSAAGVVAFYEQVAPGLLDGIVADEPLAGLTTLEIDTNMPDIVACARVAEQTLVLAATLAG
jgi:LPPG:FO 2-phospho-L-lactate transferase